MATLVHNDKTMPAVPSTRHPIPQVIPQRLLRQVQSHVSRHVRDEVDLVRDDEQCSAEAAQQQQQRTGENHTAEGQCPPQRIVGNDALRRLCVSKCARVLSSPCVSVRSEHDPGAVASEQAQLGVCVTHRPVSI